MKQYEINMTYGSMDTPCTVFVCEDYRGGKWYAVEGSCMANLTYDDLVEGESVESLGDWDCFTVNSPIESVEELEEHING